MWPTQGPWLPREKHIEIKGKKKAVNSLGSLFWCFDPDPLLPFTFAHCNSLITFFFPPFFSHHTFRKESGRRLRQEPGISTLKNCCKKSHRSIARNQNQCQCLSHSWPQQAVCGASPSSLHGHQQQQPPVALILLFLSVSVLGAPQSRRLCLGGYRNQGQHSQHSRTTRHSLRTNIMPPPR